MNTVAKFCRDTYTKRYGERVKTLTQVAQKGDSKKKLSEAVVEGIEKAAQAV